MRVHKFFSMDTLIETTEETVFKADAEWFRKTLDVSRKSNLGEAQNDLAKILISSALQATANDEVPTGLAIAAAFDFFVGAEYYTRTANNGWLYCPKHDKPLLIYPFTNACPRCVLNGEFYFHKANKPESGTIGATTRLLLCGFLNILFATYSRRLEIYLGYEPVDVVIYDPVSKITLLAEVKAAPLTTLPLVIASEIQNVTGEDGKVKPRLHDQSDNSNLTTSEIKLLLPVSNADIWEYELVSLGIKGTDPPDWFYKRLTDVLRTDTELFNRYFIFWRKAFAAYNKSEKEPNTSHSNVYWFTNAYGKPTPTPNGWPMKKTTYESISDSKSSVGMDRTDDIKKGTYQVLKIATSGKPREGQYAIKTALISNIHTVRHYDQYLADLQDIVWTRDKTRLAKTVGDLPDEQQVYNLFDGIISFTKSYVRDEWITTNFTF
jgi:hypothetical protein